MCSSSAVANKASLVQVAARVCPVSLQIAGLQGSREVAPLVAQPPPHVRQAPPEQKTLNVSVPLSLSCGCGEEMMARCFLRTGTKGHGDRDIKGDRIPMNYIIL